MHPEDIINLFKDKWVGTAEELSVAIDYFFCDIRSTVVLVLGDEKDTPLGTSVVNAMNDYYGNHYGDR